MYLPRFVFVTCKWVTEDLSVTTKKEGQICFEKLTVVYIVPSTCKLIHTIHLAAVRKVNFVAVSKNTVYDTRGILKKKLWVAFIYYVILHLLY